jgi:flagellar basal-body rod modification protein FlgD
MNLSTHAAGAFNATQAPTRMSSSGSMDYDAFLRLLIAEMQNQDPTAPKDPSEYISQFATFASVEQAMQTNSKLDALMNSVALSQAEGVIGCVVTSPDGSVTGTVVSLTIGQGGQMIATLDNGEELVLGPGVTITKPGKDEGPVLHRPTDAA